jgi:hypothetical protein
MKRLTIEDATKFISLNEDFISKGDMSKVAYYTVSEPNENGWETVTYYTSRKKNIYINREENYDSWVYIMSNPSIPNMYKIGYTKNNPTERAKQLSNSTGVVLPYEVEWAFHCFNGESLEHEVHNALSQYRVNNQREFFQISLEEAKNKIAEVGKRYTK